MARLLSSDVSTLYELNSRFTKFLESEKASSSIKVSLANVVVHPNATEARLRLSLSGQPRDTIIGSFLTRNGTGTNEGTNYVRKSGSFIWHPGEPIEREIVIELKGNNAVGKTVEVLLSTTISGATVLKPLGIISFSTDTQSVPPSGFTLELEHNFIDGFRATDSGFDENNAPCWQSRPAHGRAQDGNKELGLYVDPALYPGTDPFPIVEGKRILRSEKLITPLSYSNRTWNYTASMITSKTFKSIGSGSRIECRLAMPVLGRRGAWPAFWLMPTNGSWPPEIDMLEWPINSGHNAWTFYTTQHWAANGSHLIKSYPIDIRQIGITTDLTGFHTYGVYITEEEIKFDIDGKLTAVMENRSPTTTWYVLLNMAMGGTWPGNPTADTTFPCDMVLDWIKFYKTA